MPADVLGGGVDTDVGPVVERAEEIWRAERVIDDQRDARLFGDASDRLEVQHVDVRVADRLDEDRPRPVVDRAPEVLRIGAVDQMRLHPVFRQRVLEQVERAAVQRLGRNQLVAGVGDVQDRIRGRRRTGRQRERPASAFEGGDSLLQNLVGGVGDARVVEPEFLDGADRLGLLEVLKDEGSGLVDGHGACPDGSVRRVACMELECVEAELPVGHGWARTSSGSIL